MSLSAVISFAVILVSFEHVESADPLPLDGDGRYRLRDKELCRPKCQQRESCVQSGIEMPNCKQLNCDQIQCGDDQMCRKRLWGNLVCVKKVSCDGVKCPKEEKCEVQTVEGCLGDCPLEARCVKN